MSDIKGTLQKRVQIGTPMDQRNFTRKGSDWNSYGPKELYKKRFRLELLWIKGTLQESVHTGISIDQRNFIRKYSEGNSHGRNFSR